MSEVTGKLIVKNETKEFGNNGFTKREFVIETDSQYPQKILIELIKEKCSLLDTFKVGQVVKVHYNLNGREWINPQGEAKYFNTIVGWRIDTMEQATQQPTPPTPASLQDEDNNGLPF